MKVLRGLSLLLAASLASLAASQTMDCKPEENCQPPDCRCWNDPSPPGGLEVDDIPQMILLSFEYALNSANVELYTALFSRLVNPNQCPGVGTFFVQKTNTDFALVKSLYDNGHEIGVTSVDGTSPNSGPQWSDSLKEVKASVTGSGVLAQTVLGVRAPNLRPGGLDQFTAMGEDAFLYDASCTVSNGPDEGFLWPYTYDFAPGPACDNGEGPEQRFPGKWQVLVSDLEFNGTKCATPAACIEVKTQRDAFDMFYNSFIQHYEGRRTPFLIAINPDWVTTDFKREATIQFLEYVRAAFQDTWILSVRQALEWVRDPVPNANATADYAPWSCP